MTALSRMRIDDPVKKLLGDSAWALFGNAAAKGLIFLSFVILARLLGKEIYGEFGIIRSTAGLFLSFSTMGVGITATKYISELLGSDPRRVGRVIGMTYLVSMTVALAFCLVFAASAPQVGRYLMQAPHLVRELRLGMVLLFFTSLTVTQDGIMQGFQDYRGNALAGVASGLLGIPLYAAGASLFGLSGALYAAITVTILYNIISGLLIRGNLRRHGIECSFWEARHELPILRDSGLPATLCGLVCTLAVWASQLLVVSRPGGMAEFGLYFAAVNIQTILVFLPLQFTAVILPKLGQSRGSGDRRAYVRYARLNILVAAAASFLPALIVALFPREIMGIYGEEFAKERTILIFIGVNSVILSVSNTLTQLMLSGNKMWASLALAIVVNLIIVAATLLLMDRFSGAMALILGNGLGNTVGVFSMLYLLRGNLVEGSEQVSE